MWKKNKRHGKLISNYKLLSLLTVDMILQTNANIETANIKEKGSKYLILLYFPRLRITLHCSERPQITRTTSISNLRINKKLFLHQFSLLCNFAICKSKQGVSYITITFLFAKLICKYLF